MRRRPAAEPLARILKKRIVAHLDTDQSIEGVLMEALVEDERGVLIVRAAKLLNDDPDKGDTPLAGEQHIPYGRVVFLQLDE